MTHHSAPALTTADELEDALRDGRYADGGAVRVLDVRWGGVAWPADKPDGRAAFELGHIPGALYVDLDTELALPPARRAAPMGRHPLPEQDELQQAARGWGIDAGDTVVAYDDLGNMSSARAWWLLRYAGVADVRLLDGGLRAWKEAGNPLEKGPGDAPVPGTVTLQYGALPVIRQEEVARFAEDGVLLDARAGERFRGEVEPVDPRPGHIPGAVSAPTTANLDAAGRFLTPGELRARFAALGVTDSSPVGAYCGSGVTAAHEAMALTLAGFEPALYPGSYSAWSNDPRLPVELGG